MSAASAAAGSTADMADSAAATEVVMAAEDTPAEDTPVADTPVADTPVAADTPAAADTRAAADTTEKEQTTRISTGGLRAARFVEKRKPAPAPEFVATDD